MAHSIKTEFENYFENVPEKFLNVNKVYEP